MTPPQDFLSSITGALFALFLIFAALSGPKGPPSAPSAQLAFPYMVERKAVRDQGVGE
jgi:hypothetical protein